MKILVIDIGGTNVKCLATGHTEPRKFPSGNTLTPQEMVDGVKKITADWDYEGVSIGYPGAVVQGTPRQEPVNLGQGWVGFDFEGCFGRPVKVINDAAMQALGSYEGGCMLFLGLGTGMGSALIVDSAIAPMELAHLPFKKKTFEDYLGARGLEEQGKKKWQKMVEEVVALLKDALVADYVVIGGGNAKKLDGLPPGCRMGDNRNAFIGGYRLWDGQRSSYSPAAKGPRKDLPPGNL
jgi:predicted NBD/HSP70 family sugar kinase